MVRGTRGVLPRVRRAGGRRHRRSEGHGPAADGRTRRTRAIAARQAPLRAPAVTARRVRAQYDRPEGAVRSAMRSVRPTIPPARTPGTWLRLGTRTARISV